MPQILSLESPFKCAFIRIEGPLNHCHFGPIDLCNLLYLLHADSEEVRNSKVSLITPTQPWLEIALLNPSTCESQEDYLQV